ncbi:hypothetical protein HDV06_000715 [Boothiomyces sp. JEL0866]|nr:hypothetical protein HDV06_000715 [Boothiomyces sp. JEL0866]
MELHSDYNYNYLHNNCNIPLMIIHELSVLAKHDRIQILLDEITDILSHLERIRDTRLPFLFKTHSRQISLIYLSTLPFQLCDQFGYISILIQFFTSFILFGISKFANLIEEPFDSNSILCLMNKFCNELKMEMIELLQMDQSCFLNKKI